MLSRLALFVVALLVPVMALAQDYTQNWLDVTLGETSPLRWTHVRVAQNDDVVVGGDEADRFVAKGYTSSGTPRWSIRDLSQSTSGFKVLDVQLDPVGNLYVLTNNDDRLVTLTSYAGTNGEFRWRRSFGLAEPVSFRRPSLVVAKRGNTTFVYLFHHEKTGAGFSTNIIINRVNSVTGQTLFTRVQAGACEGADVDANGNLILTDDFSVKKLNQSLALVWQAPQNFLVTLRDVSVHPATGHIAVLSSDSFSFEIFAGLTVLNPSTGAPVSNLRLIGFPEESIGSSPSRLLPRSGGGWLLKLGETVTGVDSSLKIDVATRIFGADAVAVDRTGLGHLARRDGMRVQSYPRLSTFGLDLFNGIHQAFSVAVDSQNRVLLAGGFQTNSGAVVQLSQAFLAATDQITREFVGRLDIPAPGVLANDSNPEGGVLSVETPPTKGTLTLRQDGSFTYIPGASFVDSDQFRYRIQKGTLSRVATAFIRRLLINEIRLDPNSVVGGDPYLGSVILNTATAIDSSAIQISSSSSVAQSTSAVVRPGVAVSSFRAATNVVSSPTAATFTATLSGQSKTATLVVLPGGMVDIVSVDNAPIIRGQTSKFRLVLSGNLLESRTYRILSSPNVNITVPAGSSSVEFEQPIPAGSSTLSLEIDIIVNNRRLRIRRDFPTLAVPTLASVRIVDSPVYAGVTNRFEVTLNSPSGSTPNVVSLSSNNPKVTIPSSVSVGTNQLTASRNFTPPTVTANDTVTLTATLNGVSLSDTALIRPNLLQSLSISPNIVRAGVSTTGTVRLSWVAPALGQTVSLTSSNTTRASVPSSIFLPAGTTNKSFTIKTKGPLVTTIAVTITARLGSVTTSQVMGITP